MKRHLTSLFIFCFAFSYAQNKSTLSPKDTAVYRLEKEIYNRALRYNDFQVARNSMYKMIALNPADKSLKDSLLSLYFNTSMYGQSILLCRELLNENQFRLEILEIKAASEQSIGLIKDALETYEKLFLQTKSLYHQYQLAVLQYQLKRYGECNTNVEQILKNEKSVSEKVSITVNQKEAQEVSLKAAAYNIRGVMLLEGKREEEAKFNFEEALKLQPDFMLAKNNLAFVSKKDKPANSTPSKSPKK